MSFVHNHGPAEGEGLDCYEHVLGDNLIGRCLLREAGFERRVVNEVAFETKASAVIVGPQSLPAGVYFADWNGTVRVR